MSHEETVSGAQRAFGDIAPKLAEITDRVLFGDVWRRPELSPRDRSLVTCAALVATGKADQMNYHFPLALAHGVTRQELVELITHLAFYAGWPSAVTAMSTAKAVFAASALPANAKDEPVREPS